MEELHYKSNVTYIPYQKRILKYGHWLLLLIILAIQIFVLLVVAFLQKNVLPKFYIIFPAIFAGSVMLINYYFFAKWMRFYLEEISIDTQMCYIKFYDKDMAKKEQISLENLEIKLETASTKRGDNYKFCIYDNKKLITFQFCGIGYWSKEICEEIVKTYAQTKVK